MQRTSLCVVEREGGKEDVSEREKEREVRERENRMER